MQSEVLANLQIPDDGSTTVTTLKADIAIRVNNRYRDIWRKRLWPPYFREIDVNIPANETNVSGVQGIEELCQVRQANTVLLPIDPSQINHIDPSLWSRTSPPQYFYCTGLGSIRIMGQYSTLTKLSLAGKAPFSNLTSNDIPTLPCEEALIYGASGDMIVMNEKNNPRADFYIQKFGEELQTMIDRYEAQSANSKKVIPTDPFTNFDQFLWGNVVNTSPIW